MNSDIQIGSAQNGLPTPVSLDARGAVFEGMLWLFGIMVVATLIAVVGGYLRRRLRAAEPAPGLGLTLEKLRRLRDRGDLTVPDYEVLKGKIVSELGIRCVEPSQVPHKVLQQARGM